MKSPWRILYKASNFKLSNYDPELKCAFFSKNWWFSVQKLRVSTFQISKKAHLSTVHDKKFSTWGIPYIYLRECALMNLNEKTCFRFLNAPFCFPHEKRKNQEFVKWAWISKKKCWNCSKNCCVDLVLDKNDLINFQNIFKSLACKFRQNVKKVWI